MRLPPSKKDTPKDRRSHSRHPVKSVTIATPNRTGEIIDISMGGLAFSYIEREDWDGESFDHGVLLGERDLRIEDIPLKVISDCAINSGISVIRRCGVQFGKLTAKQMSQLEYFIWANTEPREGSDGESGEEDD
jgi:hypothetical protein